MDESKVLGHLAGKLRTKITNRWWTEVGENALKSMSIEYKAIWRKSSELKLPTAGGGREVGENLHQYGVQANLAGKLRTKLTNGWWKEVGENMLQHRVQHRIMHVFPISPHCMYATAVYVHIITHNASHPPFIHAVVMARWWGGERGQGKG